MSFVQANAWYLLLRAHDHIWNDMHDLSLEIRMGANDIMLQYWSTIPPNATIPAVLICGKRLIEVGIKLPE